MPDVRVLSNSNENAVDSYFYTSYESASTSISWVTCGHDSSSSGCYGSGILSPFRRACAIAGTSDRVYVLDAGGRGGKATLYVYNQQQSSSPSVTLLKRVRLNPIGGSSTSRCSLAVLGEWLYAGDDKSTSYAQVHLTDYSVQSGTTCGDATTAITASENAVAVSMLNCFEVFDDQGNGVSIGGQSADTVVPGSNGHALP